MRLPRSFEWQYAAQGTDGRKVKTMVVTAAAVQFPLIFHGQFPLIFHLKGENCIARAQYPWGNMKDQSRYPVLQSGRAIPGPGRIGDHSPAGDSPFGVADLVGNVWQYTDEFADEHTSRVVLRGAHATAVVMRVALPPLLVANHQPECRCAPVCVTPDKWWWSRCGASEHRVVAVC